MKWIGCLAGTFTVTGGESINKYRVIW